MQAKHAAVTTLGTTHAPTSDNRRPTSRKYLRIMSFSAIRGYPVLHRDARHKEPRFNTIEPGTSSRSNYRIVAFIPFLHRIRYADYISSPPRLVGAATNRTSAPSLPPSNRLGPGIPQCELQNTKVYHFV